VPSEPVLVPSATEATPERAEPGQPSNVAVTEAPVQLRLDGEPATARVFLGDREVGQVGQPFMLPRSDAPAQLSIRAPGYASREMSVVPSQNLTLSVKLRRIVHASKPELEY
jgi:hypothetical protein